MSTWNSAEYRPASWIYVVQMGGDDGPVKIGFSTNPYGRLRALSAANPMPLKLLTTLRGDKIDESLLHRRFKKYRVKGEWFEFSGEVKEWVGEPTSPVDPVVTALNEYLRALPRTT